MLFNSYHFIFIFLPALLFLFYYLRRSYALPLLIIASFIFYAQWDFFHLSLLLASIFINYFLSKYLTSTHKKPILFLAILLNLTPLIFYKYSTFLTISNHSLVLPLAISFYTFQQIAFLVDVYRQKIVATTLKEYLFFVMFFPQLVAGPIIHYNDIIPQTKNFSLANYDIQKLQDGIALFSIGLFSKVVLADSLAREHYQNWFDLLSYSFMIYFDFSGYATMAIGLALMFGITLPQNFNSPYKARNIIEFWRRWHITLSNFLRDHIYIPLGGNKKGRSTQVFSLLATMFIGGIWHGAGWHFLLWGVMHAVALVAVHLFKPSLPKPLAVAITFLYVTLLWVLFLSPSLTQALQLYKTLFTQPLPDIDILQAALLLCAALIIFFTPNAQSLTGKNYTPYLSAAALFIALKLMASTPAATFVYFNF